jgi:hypothetical protein
MKGEGVMKEFKVSLGLMIVMIALVGCTKEKAFEFVPNKKTVSKSVFSKEDYGDLKSDQIAKLSPDEKRKYLVPRIAVLSYGETTRTSTASMPYFQGRSKLVEFEVGEKEIEVRELEKDPRFADNATNDRIIMTIPVRHVDYDCERDAYGECQNKEIEDEKKDWKDRKYVEVDFAKAEIRDLDELPVELTNLFSGCYLPEGSQKLIGYELDKGVFNFEIQRSYKINWGEPGCFAELGNVDDLDDIQQKSTIDIRYVYSMVREDQIASKGYKPVQYAREDENAFGFFNTKLAKLDVDNNSLENTDTVLMNRWNPEKKVITYYMSDSFNKPEYDYVVEATKTAMQNINNGLAQAGAGIQVQLLPPAGKKVGDLRNNMIVLVDDPLASRVIGYGPTAAHPLTGEILNGRVVMYFGTIKTIVKRTYEEMRQEIAAKKGKGKTNNSEISVIVAKLKQRAALAFEGKSYKNILAQVPASGVLQDAINRMNLADKTDILKANVEMNKNKVDDTKLSNATLAKVKAEILKFKKADKYSPLAQKSKFFDKRIDVLSKNNIYPEELFNAEFAMKSAGIGQDDQDLKPWEDLTDNEKEQLTREVLPYIWIPTLVHEFGHNLGLRHNFAGSEDKPNFYSPEELAKMGVNREVPYSSVMDYSYRSMNELPTMGKYDIAALKYAYNRKVDLVNEGGQIVKTIDVKNKIADAMNEAKAEGLAVKEYKYCTDEHVSANPNCNRFDEGTNLTEIATHYVTAYENDYKKINKRNSRRNFSLTQEAGYMQRMMGTFSELRIALELYERIKNDYGIEEGSDLWKTIPFLKDVNDASTLSGQFFLSILLTPDVQCAIALAEEPKAPIAIVPITNLSSDATTCYHPDIQERLQQLGEANGGLNLVVAGEGGKSFRSKKDSRNENNSADEVDVQGIWIDKMLALNLLFTRELGSGLFDKYNQNYMDHGAVGPDIKNVLAAILLGRGSVPTPFRDADGNAAEFLNEKGEATNALPISIEFGEEHNILVPEVSGLSAFFGLPREKTTFAKALVRTLANLVPASVGSAEAQRFLDTFSVYTLEKPASSALKDRYFANDSNQIAKLALETATYAAMFEGLEKEQVAQLVELKKAKKKVPAKASAQIKAVYKLKVEILEAYVNGLIKSPAFYEELLDSLIARR